MGLASIIVTIAFRTTTSIGNAYGKGSIVVLPALDRPIDRS
jgi:hypothetical protein